MRQPFTILLLFCLLTNLSVCGQTDKDIIIGAYDSIQSEILKEEQWIMVYLPESHDKQQRFPVLYVLDGSWRFHSTVGMVKELGGSLIPHMIVVGILNNDRFRDFSPTGTENFTAYIEKELFPHMEKNYPVAPYRMLIGHSIAGLFAVNTLVNNIDLFNAYVLIDPSISFGNNQDLLNHYLTGLHYRKFNKATVQLAISNTLPANLDTSTVRQDTTLSTLHIRSVLEFADALTKTDNGIRSNSMYYSKESHTSVPLIATYDALCYIFDYYEMPEEIWQDGTDASTLIKAHFINISTQLGYIVLPPEGIVNSLGYYIMRKGHLDKAEEVFKLNIENYPDSYNAYDSMGDLYASKEDIDKAIENYKKALAINDNQETRDKLEKLKKE